MFLTEFLGNTCLLLVLVVLVPLPGDCCRTLHAAEPAWLGPLGRHRPPTAAGRGEQAGRQ